ncbi:hypothetical protein ACQ858_17090 [Variovorax ureilyticus]|uniref:hypothetical protein n=1 Tax=Variovorax ureilyticus TaxID=1836198 RepID=UPI003D664C74
MPIDQNKTNAFQKSMLTRAQAVTREQLNVASDLVKELGDLESSEERHRLVLQVAQVLSTNYLAETMNSKLAKS